MPTPRLSNQLVRCTGLMGFSQFLDHLPRPGGGLQLVEQQIDYIHRRDRVVGPIQLGHDQCHVGTSGNCREKGFEHRQNIVDRCLACQLFVGQFLRIASPLIELVDLFPVVTALISIGLLSQRSHSREQVCTGKPRPDFFDNLIFAAQTYL